MSGREACTADAAVGKRGSTPVTREQFAASGLRGVDHWGRHAGLLRLSVTPTSLARLFTSMSACFPACSEPMDGGFEGECGLRGARSLDE